MTLASAEASHYDGVQRASMSIGLRVDTIIGPNFPPMILNELPCSGGA